jgi:hypothetical protein
VAVSKSTATWRLRCGVTPSIISSKSRCGKVNACRTYSRYQASPCDAKSELHNVFTVRWSRALITSSSTDSPDLCYPQFPLSTSKQQSNH